MGLTFSKVMGIVRGVSLLISPVRRMTQRTSREHKIRDVFTDLTGYDYLDGKYRLGLDEPRGLLHGYGGFVGTYVAEGLVGLAKSVASSLKND